MRSADLVHLLIASLPPFGSIKYHKEACPFVAAKGLTSSLLLELKSILAILTEIAIQPKFSGTYSNTVLL